MAADLPRAGCCRLLRGRREHLEELRVGSDHVGFGRVAAALRDAHALRLLRDEPLRREQLAADLEKQRGLRLAVVRRGRCTRGCGRVPLLGGARGGRRASGRWGGGRRDECARLRIRGATASGPLLRLPACT